MKTRRRPSQKETLCSLAVLLLVGVVGALVALRQGQFNFSLFFPPGLQPGAAQMVSFPFPGLLSSQPQPWPLEVFTAENLFDKINGKAPLYLSAGFTRLVCQRFQLLPGPEGRAEVFAYEMKDPLAAFSVLTAQRREGGRDLDREAAGYLTQNALFLVHGSHYLEVVAQPGAQGLEQALMALAQKLDMAHPAQVAAIPEEKLFPEPGMDPASRALLATDAFGMSGLDRIFIAAYPDYGDATAFLSRRGSPEEAQKLARDYLAFVLENGGEAMDFSSIPGAAGADLFGEFEVVFSRGPYLAGVHGALDAARARELGLLLAEKLEQAGFEFK